MKSKLRILLLTVGIAALISGCGGGNSISGDWSVSSDANMPPGSKVTATFSGSDQLSMRMDMTQPLPNGKSIGIHADIKGTYKIEGDSMTVKAESVKFTGTDVPAELKAAMDQQFKTLEVQAKDQINEEGVTKIAWVDKDNFTLTGAKGKPQTFTRAK